MSTIPWNIIIIRMRHKIVHHYDDFNVSVVWRTVKDDIPSVAQTIRDCLNIKELSKMRIFDK